MKKIISIAIFSCFLLTGYAQQEQHYTQFMFNKLAINPAYAGSNEATCLSGIYRNQWMGIEGAPKTMMLSFNMPLMNQRVGVGANLIRNTIGITQRTTLEGDYAYRFRMSRGVLAAGINASIRHLSNNYSDDRLKATQPIGTDGTIPVGEQSKVVPNFGVGLYYHTEDFYIGLSAPRILSNNIDFDNVSLVDDKEVSHLFLMTGFVVELNDNVDLKPQVLLKYAKNSPFDAELNLMAIIKDKYSAGLTYRLGGSTVSTGESIDIVAAAQLTDNFLFGLSYDITLSELKDYNSGSIEAVLRYCFGSSEGEEIINPRFF